MARLPMTTVKISRFSVARPKNMKLSFTQSHLMLRGDLAHAGRIELTEQQRTRLEEMARSRTLAARKVLRVKIVLRC